MKQNKILSVADDFQPDAIMLEHQSPSFSLHIVWFLMVFLLVLLLAGACFAKVDKLVTAEGKVVTSRPPITMKPLELCVINKVHVKVGQKVKTGDLLFTFDSTRNASELKRLGDQLTSYEVQSRRLRSEIGEYRQDFKLPVKPNTDERMQAAIYQSRKNYYLKKLAAYDENISRYQKVLSALESTINKYRERSESLARIQEMMKGLHEKKIASLKDFLQAQVDTIATAIQIDQQAVEIVENRQQILAYQAERSAFINDWQQDLVSNLVDVERNIITLNQEIQKYKMLVQNMELRAPCNAVVHEMAPFQEGSAVREAEALITLIPVDVEIEVEVDIPAKDISWVKIGDEARLKFDAFPFQQCGTLEGKVKYISQDAFARNPQRDMQTVADDGGRLNASSRGINYQALLSISGNFKGKAKDARLIPGMRLKAEIKVGKRTVINYLLNPFVKALDESIREP